MTLTNTEALRLLELFQERDYAQGRPHFYVRSPKSNTWVRPKGIRILTSSQQMGILHWDPEEWEIVPYHEIDFGLW